MAAVERETVQQMIEPGDVVVFGGKWCVGRTAITRSSGTAAEILGEGRPQTSVTHLGVPCTITSAPPPTSLPGYYWRVWLERATWASRIRARVHAEVRRLWALFWGGPWRGYVPGLPGEPALAGRRSRSSRASVSPTTCIHPRTDRTRN